MGEVLFSGQIGESVGGDAEAGETSAFDVAKTVNDAYGVGDFARTLRTGLEVVNPFSQAHPAFTPDATTLGQQGAALDGATQPTSFLGKLGKGAVDALGAVMAAVDIGNGINHALDAADGDDLDEDLAAVDAVHDLTSGALGLFPTVIAPLVGGAASSVAAPLVAAGGAGFAVGDAIAPLIFGSEEEDNKRHHEEIPEDGVFKPTTGNQTVDAVVEWVGSFF